ncbi:hypothetical protein OIO90_002548 [Microbotryomycetes sp. JL221]|nr:hypothetical protein OIO90_002548 [Microbotryomycetes sp. JL221]
MAADDASDVLRNILPAELEYQVLRVTMHTAMNKLIQIAQDHLQSQQDCEPIVLHSLPSPSSTASTAQDGPSTSTQPAGETEAPVPDPDNDAMQPQESAKKQVASTSNAALARLVSVVEILKRKFEPAKATATTTTTELAQDEDQLPQPQDNTDVNKKTKKQRRRSPPAGLYQYTYVSTLEQVGIVDNERETEEARQQRIALDWLDDVAGVNKRPRKKHTPFMVVVLAPKPVQQLSNRRQFTCQKPTRRSKKHLVVAAPTEKPAPATKIKKSKDTDKVLPAIPPMPGTEGQKKRRRTKRKKAAVAGEGTTTTGAEAAAVAPNASAMDES